MSRFVEFCLEYDRAHQWMSVEECSRAIQIAWDRANNRPTGDVYKWWMQDTRIALYSERAIKKLAK